MCSKLDPGKNRSFEYFIFNNKLRKHFHLKNSKNTIMYLSKY